MSFEALHLEGASALVTGASGGIGLAIVEGLLRAGVRCVGQYRSQPDALQALQAENPGHLHALHADLTQPGGPSTLWDTAIRALNATPEILINNAAIARTALVRDMTVEDWDAVITTNLDVTWALCASALRRWRATPIERPAVIVNISAAGAERGLFGAAGYTASKAAMIGLTKSLAREAASLNVRVNLVSPGFTDAGMIGQIPYRYQERYRAEIPMRRFASADEIAYIVSLLASPLTEYVTGQNWVVDGGWTC